MLLENKNLSVKLTLQDRLSVRKWLAYMEAFGSSSNDERFMKGWQGAIKIVQAFECDFWPSLADDKKTGLTERQTFEAWLDVDLDKETDTRIGNVILWVAGEVAQYISELDKLPKN